MLATRALLAGRLNPAATLLNRIGAGASFHGGGLVTDKPVTEIRGTIEALEHVTN